MNTQNIHPFLKKLLNGATVEWKPLGEVAKLIRGKGLSKKDIGTGQVPIILYGELYTTYGDKIFSNDIVSFCDKSRITNQPQIQQNDILLPVSSTTKDANIGTISVYLDNKIVFLGGDAVIFRPDKSINSVFLMYCLNSNLMQKDKMRCVKGTTINHLDPQKFAKLQIPIPPLAVQSELVKILDKFTELTARKKQYAYYRDKLLTFADDAVEWKTLGEILLPKGYIRGPFGSTLKKQFFTSEGVPVYEQQHAIYDRRDFRYFIDKDRANSLKRFKVKPGDIIISCSGTIGKLSIINESDKIGVINQALLILRLDTSKVAIKYIKYYFECFTHLIINTSGGAITNIEKRSVIEKIKIPIPPLAEQERIANILNKFDTLTNSISEGIPREIELRKKQYEYYRDKLLTFSKEVE